LLLIDNTELDDKLFKLLNIVVEVAFKLLIAVLLLLIDNTELDDKLFKLLNIVVDVVFILFIDNIEFVDKLFTFVVNANTDMLVPVAVIVDVNCVELSAIKEAI
jgi:hypothetical protein